MYSEDGMPHMHSGTAFPNNMVQSFLWYEVSSSYVWHKMLTWISLTVKCLSLHYNGHFPVEPGLAGTRMSPFWMLLELRMMEVVVTTTVIRCTKPHSNRHHQQTNIQLLLQARCPFCHPTNSVKALKGNVAVKCLSIY